jgi:hypothetical protein
MRSNQSPLDAPVQAFASLHPALAALEAVIAAQTNAVLEATRCAEVVSRQIAVVEPTAWTKEIEAARNVPEELARIRVRYDEEALAFMSAFLRWEISRSRMMDGRHAVSDNIVETMIAHDAIHPSSSDALWKPIMQARLLVASKVHSADVGQWPQLRSTDGLVTAIHKILVVAFRRMAAAFPNARRQHPYTRELVIQGKQYKGFLNPDIDLRTIWPVPFVDCVNSKHPHSARLAELLEQAGLALQACYSAETFVKGDQNGRVNERQHAARLMDFLHHDSPADAAYYCGGNLEQQVTAQHGRRLDYETHRHLLLVAVHKFHDLIKEVVLALDESIKETAAMLVEVEADRCTTIDRWQTVRIMMTNCLAADAKLRRWVIEHLKVQGVLLGDLSSGAGGRALTAEFEEVRKTYGWAVDRRRKEMAGAEDGQAVS